MQCHACISCHDRQPLSNQARYILALPSAGVMKRIFDQLWSGELHLAVVDLRSEVHAGRIVEHLDGARLKHGVHAQLVGCSQRREHPTIGACSLVSWGEQSVAGVGFLSQRPLFEHCTTLVLGPLAGSPHSRERLGLLRCQTWRRRVLVQAKVLRALVADRQVALHRASYHSCKRASSIA